jgi:methionine-rich copper-binding protein CopC
MKTFACIAALLLIGGSPAYAHTELSASMPADKAALDAAPKEVMLHFTEAVRLTALSLTKRGESKQDLGPLPTETQKDFAVAAPSLTAGEYVASWRALSEDAHVMTGEFTFTVGMHGAGEHGAQHEAAPATHGAHSEPHSH